MSHEVVSANSSMIQLAPLGMRMVIRATWSTFNFSLLTAAAPYAIVATLLTRWGLL